MRSTFVAREVLKGWNWFKSRLSVLASHPFRTTLVAFLVLLAVHVLFFWPHYLGRAIFPWDFCRAYHYFAYAWVHDGGLFSPPVWMPYGSLGYPSHLTIQNSSFYLPVEIVGWLGLTYSLHVATIVQCLHILAGGIGCFVFLRTCGLRPLVALTGGMAFLLSGGFFSNGQHVDIIRGYALTPWLLAVYSPVFLRRPGAAAGAAVVTALFVIGAYPGITIATAFLFVIYFAWCLAMLAQWADRLRYLGFVALSAIFAVMLAAVKYMPLALQLDELLLPEKSLNFGIAMVCYLTALFRFDFEGMPGDITLRCMYLPSLILLSLLFVRRRSPLWMLGGLFTLFTFAFATDGSWVRDGMMYVPGFTTSRCHLSDYRGLLHLGIIMMGATALQQLAEARMKFAAAAVRGLAALAMTLSAAILACLSGYQPSQVSVEVVWGLVGTGALVFGSQLLASRYAAVRGTSFALLWAVMVLATFTYVHHMPLTWKYADYQSKLERRIYRRPASEVFETHARISKWSSRPSRHMDGFGTPIPDLGMGYYYQTFGIGGNDKGVRLIRTAACKQAMKADTSGTLLGFLSGGSSNVLSTSLLMTANELHQSAVSPVPDAHVSMVEYGLSHAVYDVNLPREMWMTENEMFFPGWRSELRMGNTVKEGPAAEASLQFLRSWRLPAGKYQLVTEYAPPGWRLAVTFSLAGLLCCGGLVALDVIIERRRLRLIR